MQPIVKKIRKTNEYSILHDTREDVTALASYCNMLADKINELNEELQETKKELEKVRKLAWV